MPLSKTWLFCHISAKFCCAKKLHINQNENLPFKERKYDVKPTIWYYQMHVQVILKAELQFMSRLYRSHLFIFYWSQVSPKDLHSHPILVSTPAFVYTFSKIWNASPVESPENLLDSGDCFPAHRLKLSKVFLSIKRSKVCRALLRICWMNQQSSVQSLELYFWNFSLFLENFQ